MKSCLITVGLFRNFFFQNGRSGFQKAYCSQNIENITKQKSEDIFISPEVQRILKKITCVDYKKIFCTRQTDIAPFKYEFVTEKRLKELQDEVAAKAISKLQMPPVMDIREPINEVLSKNPELQGYLKSTLVFTDISPSVSLRERIITVRETDGTLRKATWEERERMNQIFYPMLGRNWEKPKLFENQYLVRLLDEGSYEFVLDSACIQFEPDDPDYHKVTNATYEHIKERRLFDTLRSTRHFGPMAFYLAQKKDIDLLILDMIEKQLLSDASETISLLSIIHPDLKSSTATEVSEIELIQNYTMNTSSPHKGSLERAVQTFIEQQQNLKKEASF